SRTSSSTIRTRPRPTLFPYTTLFRSRRDAVRERQVLGQSHAPDHLLLAHEGVLEEPEPALDGKDAPGGLAEPGFGNTAGFRGAQIGRASCRERWECQVVAVHLNNTVE